ncbi:putative protein OS=Tsukamurella paurometabola (strain ATCC 8368 / DSM / CCUG 35730 /CIP 100753 / JCM 10117 / KCTC 9821 / NBRC 16120 / NCIMB 702349/ NCTC 13040) OX=521096 GN=Tpau_3045 PE=4 SV=1 [Tsukamurella paurometabola]|uniref:Uncharacterized protein n=1 Tax=Tsukamurella paurometabola (strain ATCC 8368 / DSM 20162 / CCUG 35730 / CIP 100753 / JCM 10117 / KCTC 9821 / NBRC 16120 / NCIMB 702349 / NCTC 13040) TaxID=521096 RepID=D5UUS0_TSUPD|nr:hypothetical protein Tpau_3045 [Tsukamurella paurometabola DSM 20162]SUP36555.1 Uncharacterised protein [Tsukamurella paurometabola]
MNNAVINADQFTAAKGGVFAATAVRDGASYTLPAMMTPRLWRLRGAKPIHGVDHEPLKRPVCHMRRG